VAAAGFTTAIYSHAVETHSTVHPAAVRCAACRSLCTLCTMGTTAARLPGGSSTQQGSKREKGNDREGEMRGSK